MHVHVGNDITNINTVLTLHVGVHMYISVHTCTCLSFVLKIYCLKKLGYFLCLLSYLHVCKECLIIVDI